MLNRHSNWGGLGGSAVLLGMIVLMFWIDAHEDMIVDYWERAIDRFGKGNGHDK
jgi:hypothetical protein